MVCFPTLNPLHGIDYQIYLAKDLMAHILKTLPSGWGES